MLTYTNFFQSLTFDLQFVIRIILTIHTTVRNVGRIVRIYRGLKIGASHPISYLKILKLKFFTTSRIPVKCLDFIDMFFSRVYQKLQLKSKKKHTQISITEVKATTLTSKFQKTGICRSINDHYSHDPKIVNVHIWNKKIRCKPVSKWNSTL